MGWIQANRKDQTGTLNFDSIKIEISRIEQRDGLVLGATPKYPFASEDTFNDRLPFIPNDEVNSRRRPGMVASGDTSSSPNRHEWWIVIDNIIYDCTDFVLEHPGGEQVIMSFIGEDCSWQFWRFHSGDLMKQYGTPLRIGRTEGVQNRFKEPKRFVGLSRLGRDEW